MASVDFIGSIEMEEDSTCVLPGDSQFYVGLEKCIGFLKGLLTENEVSVVGVQCMAGGGKTTLALALCNDHQIRDMILIPMTVEYFDSNVIFITVAQSPNLKKFMGTTWKKLSGSKRQEFNNLEDAHMQLKQLISRQMKQTLVILDDVRSRGDLEYLLFERPGFKTLIKTRDNSTIPATLSTRVYQLPLLCQEDALSLFCFCAFGQTSIPSNANTNLVEELLVECGGLPLALKVIGSSLYGKPHEAWETARESFSKGESISDYNKKGLIRLLEITVDSLDNVAKECFQDLSLFPEDRKICADALLDIWVYVRDLQWHNAFSILLDLASKNLLNLTSTSGSRRTISNRNTSELYFSQNNVIRELALRLECQGSVGHKKRLLLPRKEQSSSQKRELLNGTEFDVQLLSIHTGHMEENYWEEMNFPEAEALLLHFTSTECFLPPFLESMKNLKCLMVFNYSTKRGTLKGLDILSGLPHVKSVRLQRFRSNGYGPRTFLLRSLELRSRKHTSVWSGSMIELLYLPPILKLQLQSSGKAKFCLGSSICSAYNYDQSLLHHYLCILRPKEFICFVKGQEVGICKFVEGVLSAIISSTFYIVRIKRNSNQFGLRKKI
ncbi:hypothetical protein SUGI_0362230 [Cryptomeria japonica]|nr:hypothetical protein SUGI_0362230 [Cryptomeria japonica]